MTKTKVLFFILCGSLGLFLGSLSVYLNFTTREKILLGLIGVLLVIILQFLASLNGRLNNE